MRGIYKINHAVQTAEAWNDWRRLAAFAHIQGLKPVAPPEAAGAKTVDKYIDQLWREMHDMKIDVGVSVLTFLEELRHKAQA